MIKPILFALFVSLPLPVWSAPAAAPPPSPVSDTEPQVEKEVLVQSGKSWDGTPLPDYPEGKPLISIVRFVIPPHAKLPWHEHPVINAGVLVRGELTVVTEEGAEINLSAGDGLIEVVNTWHYGRNDGDSPAEIVVVYAGVVGEPLAVLKED
tara:strand:- start:41643 stop:42098 length:456 start_codon:yes stop_codon:yes gene_type:complete